MSFTDTEEKRIQAIESMLNQIQLAMNKLVTNSQLQSLLSLRQKEIDQLQEDLENLNAIVKNLL